MLKFWNLIKKIKEKVSEVRKNEKELDEFMVNYKERILFDKLVRYLALGGRYLALDGSGVKFLKNEELKKVVDEYQTLEFKISNI